MALMTGPRLGVGSSAIVFSTPAIKNGSIYPMGSMYGIVISTYIWLIFMVNVGKYIQMGTGLLGFP